MPLQDQAQQHAKTTSETSSAKAADSLIDPVAEGSYLEPWRTVGDDIQDTFQEGDFVYGLSSVRREILETIPVKDAQVAAELRGLLGQSADEIAAKDELTAPSQQDKLDFFSKLSSRAMANIVDTLNHRFLGINMRTFNMAEWTYNSERWQKSSSEHIKDFGKAIEATRYDPRQFASPGHMEVRIRKACKAGIEFNVTKGRTVHFLLDDLRMTAKDQAPGYGGSLVNADASVLGDKFRPKVYSQDGRSYTGAELRFIYRNRHRADFRQNIVFWEQGKSVLPPWESSPEMAAKFGEYQPQYEVFDTQQGPLKIKNDLAPKEKTYSDPPGSDDPDVLSDDDAWNDSDSMDFEVHHVGSNPVAL